MTCKKYGDKAVTHDDLLPPEISALIGPNDSLCAKCLVRREIWVLDALHVYQMVLFGLLFVIMILAIVQGYRATPGG